MRILTRTGFALAIAGLAMLMGQPIWADDAAPIIRHFYQDAEGDCALFIQARQGDISLFRQRADLHYPDGGSSSLLVDADGYIYAHGWDKASIRGWTETEWTENLGWLPRHYEIEDAYWTLIGLELPYAGSGPAYEDARAWFDACAAAAPAADDTQALIDALQRLVDALQALVDILKIREGI